MSIDPEVLRSEQHVEVGRLIQRDADLLIERWARRTVREQPRAARAHHQALLDHLPRFLHRLGQTLADSTDPHSGPHCAPAHDHGEQRWEEGWSLPEVVRDYQVLRLVLFDYLEETLDRPMLVREAAAIGLALDEAIAASVSAYVRQRDAYVKNIEQERAEHRRFADEIRLRWERVFQTAGWGIALLRPADNTFQAVNPAFARQHGYAVDELIGQPAALIFAPEGRGGLAEQMEQADREGLHVFEAVHLRKDGSRFPALTQAAAITDPAGTMIYRALTFQDITERKQLETFLRDQAEVLRESDRRKNEFLAMLAHELRNPLAPILTSVEVLRLITADKKVAQTRDILERQVKQMVRLVDDLLDVTRVAQGKLTLRRTRFDLAEAVNQAVLTVKPLFDSQQHRLEVHLPAEPLSLEADEARVVQIMVNLLTNAGKYTPRGGHIRLSAGREGAEAVIRVGDNGLGIEPDMLPRIFDLFTQVDRSLDRSQGGLGIGLTLVQKLVELHSGRVTAHSDGPGQGSEFVVRLPAAPGGAGEGSNQADDPPAAPGQHILIIEDNTDARETLATLLRMLGHRTETAATGQEGVERALAARPRVVLIDLGLPELDGFEVARRLRSELGEGVLLIALTGHAQEEDRRRTSEAGFDAHLAKPVELEELNRVLTART